MTAASATDCHHTTIEPATLSTGEVVSAVCAGCLREVPLTWLPNEHHASHRELDEQLREAGIAFIAELGLGPDFATVILDHNIGENEHYYWLEAIDRIPEIVTILEAKADVRRVEVINEGTYELPNLVTIIARKAAS